MNKEEALAFLKNHECMSPDETQDVIDTFDHVRRYFISNPDERCIPLFLRAFGNHMGWGLFQLCDDVFNKYEPQKIVTHLKTSLKSDNAGTRWWAAHWAIEYPSPELSDQLINLVNSTLDSDAHYFALATLGEIYLKNDNQVIYKLLKERKESETEPEIRELLAEYV